MSLTFCCHKLHSLFYVHHFLHIVLRISLYFCRSICSWFLKFSEARYSSNTKAKIIEQDRKGLKKKKKKIAKKAKKHLKYLLIPFTIQLALLPFFLKNLFMVAIKALLAGKAALVLIVFNLLRNAKIENENDKIRIEHYGYSQGEEYGAWINGRMLKDLPEDSKGFNSNEMAYRGLQLKSTTNN